MGVSYFWAVRVENFIIGTGPTQKTAHGLVLQQALQRSGDNALLAVGAVVSGDVDVVLVEELAELVLHKQEVLGAGAHDGVHLVAGLDQCLATGKAIAADAAANDGAGALSHLGGNAQRATTSRSDSPAS